MVGYRSVLVALIVLSSGCASPSAVPGTQTEPDGASPSPSTQTTTQYPTVYPSDRVPSEYVDRVSVQNDSVIAVNRTAGRYVPVMCSWTAVHAVWAVLKSHSDRSFDGVTVGSSNDDDRSRIQVSRVTPVARNGTVETTPAIGYTDLAAITPDAVVVTQLTDARTHTCRLPIAVRNTTLSDD